MQSIAWTLFSAVFILPTNELYQYCMGWAELTYKLACCVSLDPNLALLTTRDAINCSHLSPDAFSQSRAAGSSMGYELFPECHSNANRSSVELPM
ncbi:hypothetical protein BD410DRAFT_790633 [Rickenella mellea]|uniref:Secreted protein n=1 Tax=Rickenella mellea TaxID=50990 RepID=A0A4Y7Q0I6_9AGAM|nr:hypothetical protein BD410DRAFT_790633 [Rickenella mellea]